MLLSKEEQEFIDDLKEKKILRPFNREETMKITKNGGVLLTCSDGDVDISKYHSIAISKRNHEIKLFGGTLNVIDEYRGYSYEEERIIVENIVRGFLAKQTRTLFLGHHVPCGMAKHYLHEISEVVWFNYLASMKFKFELNLEINQYLPKKLHLEESRVIDFFHTKKINAYGNEEQNTYIFCSELYEKYRWPSLKRVND